MEDEVKRKHIQQFTNEEVITLMKLLHKIRSIPFDKVKFSWHTRNRINQKKLFIEGVSAALYRGIVFEIKVHADGDVRLVFRHNDFTKKRATCIVYSLRTGEIVTAWSNNVDDKHETIDWNFYTQELDIVKIVEHWTV